MTQGEVSVKMGYGSTYISDVKKDGGNHKFVNALKSFVDKYNSENTEMSSNKNATPDKQASDTTKDQAILNLTISDKERSIADRIREENHREMLAQLRGKSTGDAHSETLSILLLKFQGFEKFALQAFSRLEGTEVSQLEDEVDKEVAKLIQKAQGVEKGKNKVSGN